MDEIILSMTGIEKSFMGVSVLKNVDFDLRKGEIHALVGGNGAGKSTLMKILTGVYSKDAGQICVAGEEVDFHSVSDARRHGIDMIFQELSLVPSMTIEENLFLNCEPKKGPFRDINYMRQKTKEALQNLNLDVDPSTPVSHLSVGMSQLVEIAKAVSKNSRILVLDEPTASLSESETALLFKTMRKLKNDGVSMIYISHRMNEILEIADRITVLKDGSVVSTDLAADLSLEKIVSNMLGGSACSKFSWVERHYDKDQPDLLTVSHMKIDDRLNDISFSLKPGEILGFAGLMGSGRTEILETLFGLRPLLAGSIKLEGREINNRDTTEAVRNHFALVPEDRRRQGLVLTHSVKENMVLPSASRMTKGLFFNDEKQADELVTEKIDALSIKTDSPYKVINLLSGGNQQKVVVAKWMSMHPKIIMLDEPTAGIDIGAKGELIKIIRDFADSGGAVLFVSSEITELMAVCDRFITIFDGKITGNFSREEIPSEEVLQHAIQRQ